MEKIKSITEAYSMQPAMHIVFKANEDETCQSPNLIKEIKHEQLQVSHDGADFYYVGYNFQGKKLFQYLANSVNVQFYCE